ncbi:MAG: sigma-70 family RNA polymerase sigma factor [Lentisphaeria bacterium]|jgi:RNA polymerase sigma-70 factor (ECF subfamily)
MHELPQNDQALIAEYLAGRPAAFDQLYEKYRLPLYGYLHRLANDPAGVDDLFQQTWLKILEALPRYRDEQRFGAWAFRIAHNAAMDRFRRRGEEHTELTGEVVETVADPAGDTLGRLAEEELKRGVAAAIEQLAPEQKEVLLLRQQGLAFKEIAEVQQTGINTVLGRMHYAVRHLRRRLAGWDDEARTGGKESA